VDKSDFVGMNMIAFRRMNQMDISGNVVTGDEHLSSLKVRYRDNMVTGDEHLSSLKVRYYTDNMVTGDEHLSSLKVSISTNNSGNITIHGHPQACRLLYSRHIIRTR
jgi:hypothetical protein